MKLPKLNLRPGDYHAVVADSDQKYLSEMKIYSADGKLLHTLTCLAKGQTSDYTLPRGDTPMGQYYAGVITKTKPGEPWHIWRAFGEYFIDMVEIDNAESKHGRAGVGCHGGGSGAPDPLAPYQKLVPTYGCLRAYNADLKNIIVPLVESAAKTGNRFYFSVYQL